MSNSRLVSYTKLSPNYTAMTNKVNKKITIHHMAGNLSIERCGDIFAAASRGASSNYGIGSDGRIGLYVDESNRAWTSSNRDNDSQAITIEVANDVYGGDWHISDKALAALIELCVDICKRNGIDKLNYTGDKSGNLTRHNMFAATACPGAYLQSKFPYIASEVNKRLNNHSEPEKSSLYRVRKSWDEPKSQIGAFKSLDNAKSLADSHSGYMVFDDNGKQVYPAIQELVVGNIVKLTKGATYYNGASIPSWLFKSTLYLREINGDRAVISTQRSGAITGAVNRKYLVRG